MPAAVPLTFSSLLAALRRRRGLLFWPVGLAFGIAALSCILATPRFKAVAEVQVQREDGGAFGLENTVSGASGGSSAADSLDYGLTLQTEAALVRSPALALSVIESMHLEPTRDYFGRPAVDPFGGWWRALKARVPWRSQLEPLSVPLSQAPGRRYVAEKIFASRLSVKPIAGTRLMEIGYMDRDPARAAAVANAITGALSDAVFQQRFTSTVQGSAWLTGKLDALRRRTEEAQARAAELERGTGMFGNDASRNVVLERLDSLNQTLTAAESNRILKESIDRVAQQGSPELISSLSGNSSSGQVASINTSLTLIQGLRQQEAQIRSELDADSVRYGAAYPRIAELRAQLQGVTQSITAETRRLGQRAHTDYEIAASEEAGARAAFERQKQLAARQNDAVIHYELARQEADSSRALYEGLLAKLQQANLLAGLRANNISVVSPAEVLSITHPASPRIVVRLAAALAAGLLLGLFLVMLAELSDTSIYSAEQVEQMLGVPLLAVLPAMERSSRRLHARLPRLLLGPAAAATRLGAPATRLSSMPVLDSRPSGFAEGLRTLRTALQFSRGGAPPQVILVTSSVAGEGKSTVAANLAASFAQSGARTLLVDADLRRPSLHAHTAPMAEAAAQSGLAMALSGPDPVPSRQVVPALPNLELLCGSEVAPFPAELLASARMRELVAEWRARYDIVIFDSPPALPVTDAALLAQHSDAMLLVARHRQTTRQALRRGVQVLAGARHEAVPIGVVMNDVSRSDGYREYFGYGGEMYASQHV